MSNPRLPTAVKKLRGTMRADRENPAEPDVKAVYLPAPPEHLTAIEKMIWTRLAPCVDMLSVAGEPDVDGFEMMVRVRSRFEEVAQVADNDIKLFLALSKDVAAWYSKFGLTPQSRAMLRKLKSGDKKAEEALDFLELN